MTGSPSRLNEPIVARDCSVMRGLFSSFTFSRTSTSDPVSLTSSTLPTSTPATRTTAPLFRPLTSGNFVISLYCSHEKPALPADRDDEHHRHARWRRRQ